MLATRARAYAGSEALRDDLVAAFIVAILLIPQSLAYALLAGLPPQVGVYASLLPMMLAEELCADWSRVRVEQAWPGGRFRGIELHTSGSSSAAESSA